MIVTDDLGSIQDFTVGCAAQPASINVRSSAEYFMEDPTGQDGLILQEAPDQLSGSANADSASISR
ncbi:hypothetical protein GCM10011488_51010 [Steroidobacter agaridevorans]|nr:hypothetical protein GCM10011488_51010 [Steroidobacter agaridevorans]